MNVRTEKEQWIRLFRYRQEFILHIKFLTTDRPTVGRPPIHISTFIIINEKGRILKVVEYRWHCLPVPPFGIIGIKYAHGSGWIPTNIEYGIFIIMGSRSIATFEIPFFGSNKVPIQQVLGMPVTPGTGNEHIIFSTKLYYGRVSTRAVGDIFRRIVYHIGIVYIQRITISIHAHVLRQKGRRQA